MAELTIELEAEAELAEAADGYEGERPGLGLDFLLEMRTRMLEAAEAPNAERERCRGGSLALPPDTR